MLQYPSYTRGRLKQLVGRMRETIYPAKKPVDELLVSTQTGRISYAEAQRLEYRPAKLGEQFGPHWATYWFKAHATVPQAWAGQRVDLLWASHSEATLWLKGRALQGLNHGTLEWEPQRPDAVLLERAAASERVEFEIEMACNRLFGASHNNAYRHLNPYVLDQCDIALFDPLAWEMYYDFMVLQALEVEQDKDLDKTWAGELLAELNRFANLYDPDDRATWSAAHAILKDLYTRRNATRVHETSALGHAHLDLAWLWPLAEGWRKAERTISSQLAYMDVYPEYKFGCSQAYLYHALKEKNPELYQRLAAQVKKGRFVPVGGTWVEMDCNLPSGESLARQFLYGQRFFRKEFGITCREFWNPDVFGYNGQLPQLMRLAGITRFLTQKLSWNRFNKPWHHTFTWQGLDGSEVLAHFPPADNYGCSCSVGELRDAARKYKDHDRSRHGLLLFGHSDGGGGPTKTMLEILKRARDLQGLPRTQIRTSDEFFTLLEQDCTNRPVIVGELYLEVHRGTYTTQALTKKNNRKNEFLLHDLEFLAACTHRLARQPYPAEDLERAWKLLLLNQFHDILPGSSIGLVYEETARQHEEIRRICVSLRERSAMALVESAATEPRAKTPTGHAVFTPVNTLGFARNEVTVKPGGVPVFVEAPSYGLGQIGTAPDQVTATAAKEGRLILENSRLRATLSPAGTLESLVEKQTGRESLAGPANIFQIFDDNPTENDAWDIDPFHLETEKDCAPAKVTGHLDQAPLRAGAVFERKVGRASSVKQTVLLAAGARRLEFHTEVDWHESHKLLKVAFPVAVRALNATYEMQFGYVERPTHFSTTYDLARFEVPGHKWANISEHGFGVALLSESKYGFSTFGHTLRLSLLRAPKSPDAQANMGKHSFSYALMPHAGGWREAGVVAESYRFNVPILWTPGGAQPRSFFSINAPNLVMDTVKKAEDSEALIVRLYEAHGARGTAELTCALPFTSATFCNILEENVGAAAVAQAKVQIPYMPHQIISVKLE